MRTWTSYLGLVALTAGLAGTSCGGDPEDTASLDAGRGSDATQPVDGGEDGSADAAGHDAGVDAPAQDSQADAPPAVSLKLEAEDATLSGAVVATDHTGYSGTGFADYVHDSDDYVEWSADVEQGGDYEIAFAYALGSGDRPLKITVNDTVVNASLPFPSTGSFDTWVETGKLKVGLKPGVNKIRATAIGSSGPNVDYLTVSTTTPPKPTDSTCQRYGMLELTFKGNTTSTPDDVGLNVTFTSPKGTQKSVFGFYDGNNE